VETLLIALKKLIGKGHTLLCIEHDPAFILASDWMVDLGLGSAAEGGSLIAEGFVNELIDHPVSVTASELRKYLARDASARRTRNLPCSQEVIDAPIRLTAVTGISGSGKSSLVYGTLFAESQRRFLEGQSSYTRQFQPKTGVPVFSSCQGLVPSISLQKKNPVKNPRSTIATYTGLYDLYRLMFSRLATSPTAALRPLSTAFSFNSDEGACPVCKGLGTLTVCDADKLITNPEKPVIAGALDGNKTGRFYGDPYGQYVATLLTVGEKYDIDFSVPYQALSAEAKEIALNGCGDEIFEVNWKYKRGAHEGVHKLTSSWPGFRHLVETEYIRKHADARGEAMLDLMKSENCDHCQGFRLKPEILQFQIGGLHIGQVTALSAEEASGWFAVYFGGEFENELEKLTAGAFEETISGRLDALQKAGLGYISTDRIVGTLSGGEFQRLQLAGLVRAPLTGVAYILDEPSFGLHPKDTLRIADLIANLNQHGNTIILVDHSPLLLEKADYLIEMGPGAGVDGGELCYAGAPVGTHNCVHDVVHNCVLDHLHQIGLKIIGAFANNLQNIDIEIYTGIITVITGVSGSGKTSLLDRVIYGSYELGRPSFCESIAGFENFSDLIYVEQPLPGKGRTATVGSMLGISDIISRIFADAAESKVRGYKASHFIAGSRESRCPECEGSGVNQVSMDFLDNVDSPCERCNGTGFKDEIMEILIDGKSIFDVLHIPFDDLSGFLEGYLPSKSKHLFDSILSLIEKTGLGHLSSGRSLKTLSTGELQRLKLVSGLAAKTSNNTLILLDEPTGGLHPKDINKLLKLFNELVESGNTIVCVTHEPQLIAGATEIIELGPGGGVNGGKVVE
jgi:excinuclease ABC subunit A